MIFSSLPNNHRLTQILLIFGFSITLSQQLINSNHDLDMYDGTSGNLNENYVYDYYGLEDKYNQANSARIEKVPSTQVDPTTQSSPLKLDDYYNDEKIYDYKQYDDYKYDDDVYLDTEGHQFIDPNPAIITSKPDVQAPTTTTQMYTTQKTARSKLWAIMAKPGILAGIIGGAIIGVLTAFLLIIFIVYRMKKKDEGSYALEETKKPLNAYDYRNCPTKEFYA